MMAECDFCDVDIFQQQGIVENSVAYVLYPQHPVITGHFLIVTKKHTPLFTDLDDKEILGIRDLISILFESYKETSPEIGFNIINNNNAIADQHIPHLHIHIFIREKNQQSPFDILSEKIKAEKITPEEWAHRLNHYRSWFK